MTIDEYEKISMGKLRTKSEGRTITLNSFGLNDNVITSDKALKIEAVYSCVRDKSESIGMLPVKMYQVAKDNTLSPVHSGRMHRIFTKQPCEYLTMQGFVEMAVMSLEMNGAFYAYLERNDRNNIMSIIPFANQRGVRAAMDINGNVYYTYATNDGNHVDPYHVNDLVVVNLSTLDGYSPMSPIRQNAQLLGIAYSQDESYKELQDNGITSNMALKTDRLFNDDGAIKRLKDDMDQYRGAKGRRNIPILEDGLTPVSMKLTPAETELISHKEFTVDRICRMFRVPPELVGMNQGKATDLDIVNENYMNRSLNPLIVKLEYALNNLLTDGLRIRFDRKAFYSGSPYKMVEAVEREVKGGLAMVNEGRIDLGRDPVEGGDVFAVDSNNVTYGTWDELKAIQAQLHGDRRNEQEGNNNVEN